MSLKNLLIFAITTTVLINVIYCDIHHVTVNNITYIRACDGHLYYFIRDFCDKQITQNTTASSVAGDSNRQKRESVWRELPYSAYVFKRGFNEDPNYVSQVSSHPSPTLKAKNTFTTYYISRSTGLAGECCKKYCSVDFVVSICPVF